MNPLNRQWFYKGFHRRLTDSMGKVAGDQVWRDAGEIFSGILASQPELKRHKGAMALPAVALYRVLTVWYGVMWAVSWKKPAATSSAIGESLCPIRRTCTAWIFYPVLTMSWQSSWGMKRLSCASVIWIRRIRGVFDISVMTAIQPSQKGPEHASTDCGLILGKIKEIKICALSQWGRRRFRRSCLYTGFPQQPRAVMGKWADAYRINGISFSANWTDTMMKVRSSGA